MVEVGYDTLTAWHELLEGISVDVFKTSVLPDHNENYVIVRFESESTEQNNSAFMKNPVVIVETACHFINSVDPSVGWGIINEVMARVYGSQPGNHGLVVTGFQLYGVEEAGTSEIIDGDENPIIHRIVKRFLNRTIQ